MATRYLSRALLSTNKPLSFLLSHSYATAASSAAVIPKSSFIFRLRPIIAAVSTSYVRLVSPSMSTRGFSTRQSTSSPDDPNPNRSNREKIEPGMDFEHWLVVMEKPEPGMTRDEIIDSYIKTLAMVLGSEEEEARMKIYSVSTKHYYAFGALVSEELSNKIKELPNVDWVLPDSYLDVENKDYGGEPFINGQAVPYDPKYHKEWLRNHARANRRSLSKEMTSSSLDDPNLNRSNRPPDEKPKPVPGCDFEHWLVVMEKPEPSMTRDEIIDSYIKTLATVLGSEEEARMKIYSVSTKHYYAFGALVSEELSNKIKEMPNVIWVIPDSYLDIVNKDYGGEPFINGQAVPYDPKYHEEWVRNHARANRRSLSKEKMEDAMVENDVEINNQSEASVGEKRKSEGKLRSKVWQHFTKIVKEDGKCDKCQCNHCQKLFNYSSGTSYLLRHITDGKCPIFKKENSEITISDNSLSQNSNTNAGLLPWKSDGPSSAQQCTDDEVELVPNLESQPLDDPTPVLCSSRSSELPVKLAWMDEFRSCVDKLVELVNGKLPAAGAGTDYSISAALRCLNEMEDIPRTSEMYLDAIEILQDAGERELLICLPPESRRRWMQRVLHRRHPLQYSV